MAGEWLPRHACLRRGGTKWPNDDHCEKVRARRSKMSALWLAFPTFDQHLNRSVKLEVVKTKRHAVGNREEG